MNKEDAHHYIFLAQALIDGKTIQYGYENGNDGELEWEDTTEVYQHYSRYRIKPEPRTFVIYVNKYTHQIHNQNYGDHDWEQINVQEVLK
jgi:hypothetical protein